MKKIVTVLSLCCLTAGLFAGCSGSDDSALKDGIYRAEMKAESHGYKDYVEIKVAGGKIDTVVYDAENSEGKKKSEDEDYKQAMMTGNKNIGKPETYPADYMKKLADSLIEHQDVGKVDAVAGATNSANDFKAMVTALQSNMKSGKNKTVVVDNTK